MIGLASLAVTSFCSASSSQEMGKIYEKRCANCHGITANGVPKIKEQPGVTPEEANTRGMASQEKMNIYGPPLNHLSEKELVAKLINLRGKDLTAVSPHSVMEDNLKKVEAREGKIDDEDMAEYIHETFGSKK